MLLFQMIIQVAVRPVYHPIPKDIPNAARVGIMAIRSDPVEHDAGHRPG
jgi:hypothetical protein